jgi:Protein of unknown function (DUF2889)
LRHDGERVTGVEARSRRWPWTTCPNAAVPLHAIEGMELSQRCLAVGDHADPHANCTHMFDLAGLAVAQAWRTIHGGSRRRQYDVEIPRPAPGTSAIDVSLERDGEHLLTWQLDAGRCVSPAPFSDIPWRGGFLRWADQQFEPEESESAIVLRRACDIGMGRGMDLDAVDRAEELGPLMSGVCFTMQPTQIQVALRNKGTIRDFDDDPGALLADGP